MEEEQGSRQRDGQRETQNADGQTDQYGPGSEKQTQGVERQDKEKNRDKHRMKTAIATLGKSEAEPASERAEADRQTETLQRGGWRWRRPTQGTRGCGRAEKPGYTSGGRMEGR